MPISTRQNWNSSVYVTNSTTPFVQEWPTAYRYGNANYILRHVADFVNRLFYKFFPAVDKSTLICYTIEKGVADRRLA
jgi:hypothetical protein